MTVTALRKIDDIILPWIDTFEKNKEPTVEVRFSDDPIALSWASYHVWINKQRRWVSLNDVEAHQHDRTLADATRRYYRDRIAIMALKGKPLTEFQTVLYGMVSGEKPILNDQIGILMKIPYFYTEDITLDHVFRTTKNLGEKLSMTQTREATITPYEYTFSSRKGLESHQYWFTDDEGYCTLWSASSTNALGSVVRSLYNKKCPLRIRANWSHSRQLGSRREHVFWNLSNVELL